MGHKYEQSSKNRPRIGKKKNENRRDHQVCGPVAFGCLKVESHNKNRSRLLAYPITWVLLDSLVELVLSYSSISLERAYAIFHRLNSLEWACQIE